MPTDLWEADFRKDRNLERLVKRRIREAAEQRHKVRLRYKKVTTGNWVTRTVEPYSYRLEYHRDNQPGRKLWTFFYAYHPKHRTIEKYLLRHIREVTVTEQDYDPRWKVEISEAKPQEFEKNESGEFVPQSSAPIQ